MLMTSAEQTHALRALLSASATDAAVRQRIVTDPRAALAGIGIALPPDAMVRTVEDTPTLRHVLLVAPPGEGEVADDELGGATGGATPLTVTIPVVFTIIVATATVVMSHEH